MTRLPNAAARAVLIGTATYRVFDEIPHSYNNIRGLAGVLTDPELSSFTTEHVRLIDDPATPADIMQPLKQAAEDAEDILLVYYSGHGQLSGENSELHLTLTGSEPEAPWSSLPFSYVADIIKQSEASTKIVVLDCCYSGRAHSDLMSDPSHLVKDQLAVEGLYCLTSAPKDRRSKAPDGDTYSAFTQYLLDTLNDGIPAAGPLLRMADIYGDVRKRMRATKFPLPEQCNKKEGGDFPLARNRAYGAFQPEPAVPELDFSRSRAVVIGCATYHEDGLTPLPSSRNDALAIHRALLDATIFGFAPEHCSLVLDPATPADLFGPVGDAADDAEDLLFVYYSGHSALSHSGALALLTCGSRMDRLSYTAAPASVLAGILGESRAREHVVIADVCYGGRLSDAFSATAADVYTLCSADRNRNAFVAGDHGAFTAKLLKTLQAGIPGAAAHLNLIDIFSAMQNSDGSEPAPFLSLSGTSKIRCLLRNSSDEINTSAHHSCLMTG
ncbi:caspase family protein [Streptomyces olivaceus]|uniref:caspase family protein n=1 Tax=Streptomyces olivaceus TaxID=47716 RepID=UPI001CCF4B51|nr:caspase family protein [Streptomyces olivaceus]